jgi:hypothetical protein
MVMTPGRSNRDERGSLSQLAHSSDVGAPRSGSGPASVVVGALGRNAGAEVTPKADGATARSALRILGFTP